MAKFSKPLHSDSHLSETQSAELTEYLTKHLLPTTQAIIALVDEWWGVRYTVVGMTKWLHRNGFSYRNPVGVPHKCSAEAQQAFVETYEKLKQEAGCRTAYYWYGGFVAKRVSMMLGCYDICLWNEMIRSDSDVAFVGDARNWF